MDIDKIRSAVLAYCEEVCPNVSIDVTPIGFGDLCIHKDELEDSGPCWQIGTIGRPKILAIIQPEYFNSNRQKDECIAAYRLLGLEARDAVDKERAIGEEYLARLKAERARNTALVESINEAIHHGGYFYANGDGENHGHGGEKVLNVVGKILTAAIEANTEKGEVKR